MWLLVLITTSVLLPATILLARIKLTQIEATGARQLET